MTRRRACGTRQPERPSDHRSSTTSSVNVVAFSSDGKTIMTGGEDQMVRLWDALTGTPLGQPIPQSGAVDAAAFSPDGKSFVVGCCQWLGAGVGPGDPDAPRSAVPASRLHQCGRVQP